MAEGNLYELGQVQQGVGLPTGKANQANVQVVDLTVTAKVEAEYLVVPLARKLQQHQPAGETPLTMEPIAIELSLEQTPKKPALNATLTSTGSGKLDLFEDLALTKPFDPSKIPAAKLADGNKLRVFAVGNTAGKFELTLEASATPGTNLKQSTPGKLEMGVVAIEGKVHVHNQTELAKLEADPDVDPIANYHAALEALVVPPQVAMTDADKVKLGRFLHEQKDASHGRARLEVQQLVAGNLPAGVDDYKVVIDQVAAAGSIGIFDAEFDGNEQALPLEIPFSTLVAGKKEFWVEGKVQTPTARGATLDLGIDRPAGGLGHTRKRNADFAFFTVVKIGLVDVDYTQPAGKANAWDTTKHRFKINLDADPAGRKVSLKAKLTHAIPGVVIHLTLAPHRDNLKKANWGEDLPAAWKWHQISADLKHKDKAKRKGLLHLSAATDATGTAKVEVTLSRFGGDVFLPGAYLSEDPHLAKFVDGHATLEKKKPALASYQLTVWREFWYQLSRPKGFAAPQPTAAEGAYDRVKSTMTLGNSVEYEEATAPARTFYPKFMFDGGSDANKGAVVGSHNKTAMSGLFVADPGQPVKNHLIVCEYQYDVKTAPTGAVTLTLTAPPAGGVVKLRMGEPVVDPPLQGGSFVTSATWTRVKNPASTGDLSGNVSIVAPRAANDEVTVTLPASVPTPSAADPIRISVRCVPADGPYLGESFGINSLIVFDATDVPDYNDTVAHEIGHGFRQTPKAGKQPATIPEHPNWFQGMGVHCNFGNKKCVMYESGPQATAIHRYCEICHPYLLVEDFSNFRPA